MRPLRLNWNTTVRATGDPDARWDNGAVARRTTNGGWRIGNRAPFPAAPIPFRGVARGCRVVVRAGAIWAWPHMWAKMGTALPPHEEQSFGWKGDTGFNWGIYLSRTLLRAIAS